MNAPICPRCNGLVPSNLNPGAYPGAMSRATEYRDIEVCSRCGTDEAIRQVETGSVEMVANWPLINPHFYAERIGA